MSNNKIVIHRDGSKLSSESGLSTIQIQGKGKIAVKKGAEVEIVFVVDTTGSMEDKINALKETCKKVVAEFEAFQLDIRFAVISFGDVSVPSRGDKILIEVPLTDDINVVQAGLQHMRSNNGFGDGGESPLEALDKALQLSFRPNAIKVMVLITDDYAHQNRITARAMIDQLKQRECMTFVLSIPAEYYKAMALETGGSWTEISASSTLNELLDKFRQMATKMAQTANKVQLTGGSVANYLKLNPPK